MSTLISSDVIRVLIADDEEIVRFGLKSILRSQPEIEIVGEAHNGEEAIAQTGMQKPDVVLMDIGMPVVDGISATAQIREEFSDVKVLILTTHAEDEKLLEAIKKGASGYVLKSTPPPELISIVKSVFKGYMQLGPQLAQKLQEHLSSQRPAMSSDINRTQARFSDIDVYSAITPREYEVLTLIAEGLSNKEIAQTLIISEKTVKNHVSNLLRRVGLRDRTQLAIWANTTDQLSQKTASST